MTNYITSVSPNSNSALIHPKLLKAISLPFVLKRNRKKIFAIYDSAETSSADRRKGFKFQSGIRE